MPFPLILKYSEEDLDNALKRHASNCQNDLVDRSEELLADLELAGEYLAAAHMSRVLDALTES